jgi:hypothetical protein
MKRRSAIAGVLAALVILISVGAASAHEVSIKQNLNVTPIQGFPSPIVAGSNYTARFLLNNTGSEAVTFFVNMNVSNSHYPVGFREFFVSMWMNSNKLNCSERRPGSFYCYNKTAEYGLKAKASSELYINFSSLPNLFPDDNYTFSLDVLSQNPPANLLFADGSGQLSLGGGKRVTGQAKIYTDSGRSVMRFWIKDTRTRSEYTRTYEVIGHYRMWYGEFYDCRSGSGQTFRITVYFSSLVYATGTDVYFYGWKRGF